MSRVRDSYQAWPKGRHKQRQRRRSRHLHIGKPPHPAEVRAQHQLVEALRQIVAHRGEAILPPPPPPQIDPETGRLDLSPRRKP